MKKIEKTLSSRLMTRFVVCMVVLIILAIPLLYFITTQFYAEDLDDIVTSYGIKNPDIDIEQDTMEGLFIQFFSIISILLIAVLVVMRYVPQRLWSPFKETLEKVKHFRVESGVIPQLSHSGTKEFDELNDTLTSIMTNSIKSYKVQKEFTENASHELQTPLAIIQGKLDNLLQDKDLTEHQADEIQQIYQEIRHTSRLSRNLLLLSKIENNQYKNFKEVNLCEKIDSVLPNLEGLAGDIAVKTKLAERNLTVSCNEVLLESMLNNLIVNAVRHNRPNGAIYISVSNGKLTIANESDEPELDNEHIFSRFYRVKSNQKGNGLGLAIVKSICDYHHWTIHYIYREKGVHEFEIAFSSSVNKH